MGLPVELRPMGPITERTCRAIAENGPRPTGQRQSPLILGAPTETRLVETLSRLKSKMTIVVVTHRPTMLDIADKKLELGA